MQLVLPENFWKRAIHGYHKVGHLGCEEVMDLMRDRFHRCNMVSDTQLYIRQCERCIRFNAKPTKEPLHHSAATYPLQLVHLDCLTIEDQKGGKDINVLLIMDHFTRYTQALVTPSQAAKVTAQALWSLFIVHYRLPEPFSQIRTVILKAM